MLQFSTVEMYEYVWCRPTLVQLVILAYLRLFSSVVCHPINRGVPRNTSYLSSPHLLFIMIHFVFYFLSIDISDHF